MHEQRLYWRISFNYACRTQGTIWKNAPDSLGIHCSFLSLKPKNISVALMPLHIHAWVYRRNQPSSCHADAHQENIERRQGSRRDFFFSHKFVFPRHYFISPVFDVQPGDVAQRSKWRWKGFDTERSLQNYSSLFSLNSNRKGAQHWGAFTFSKCCCRLTGASLSALLDAV